MNSRQRMRSALEPDRIIGFQVMLPDVDDEPASFSGFYALEGQASTWRDASTFVDGILLSCGGDCGAAAEPSAVGQDSWGRIKASLR